MDRDIAVALLDQLHSAQNEFYGVGGDALRRDLVALSYPDPAPGLCSNPSPGGQRQPPIDTTT
jgi:hypothetical protein